MFWSKGVVQRLPKPRPHLKVPRLQNTVDWSNRTRQPRWRQEQRDDGNVAVVVVVVAVAVVDWGQVLSKPSKLSRQALAGDCLVDPEPRGGSRWLVASNRLGNDDDGEGGDGDGGNGEAMWPWPSWASTLCLSGLECLSINDGVTASWWCRQTNNTETEGWKEKKRRRREVGRGRERERRIDDD